MRVTWLAAIISYLLAVSRSGHTLGLECDKENTAKTQRE